VISASVPGWGAAARRIDVEDNEPVKLFIGVEEENGLNGKSPKRKGLVTILSSMPFDLVVDLFSDDPSEWAVPPFVIIPAGETVAFFDLALAQSRRANPETSPYGFRARMVSGCGDDQAQGKWKRPTLTGGQQSGSCRSWSAQGPSPYRVGGGGVLLLPCRECTPQPGVPRVLCRRNSRHDLSERLSARTFPETETRPCPWKPSAL